MTTILKAHPEASTRCKRLVMKANFLRALCLQRIWGNGNKNHKRQAAMKLKLGRGYLKTFNR
jgi:hypothetical protein